MIKILLKRVRADAPYAQAATRHREGTYQWHKMASEMSALRGLGALYVAPVQQRSGPRTNKHVEQQSGIITKVDQNMQIAALSGFEGEVP